MRLTIDDLKICHSLAAEAKEILDMIEEIRAIAECVSPTYTHTPSGSSISDKVGDGAARMADFCREREEVAAKYLEHVEVVDRAIEGLEDSYQRRVLRLRYLKGLSWEAVGAVVCYSEPRLYEIHREAIKNLGISETS